MSIKLMSQVWEMADVSGSELLLLLALADYAGVRQGGAECGAVVTGEQQVNQYFVPADKSDAPYRNYQEYLSHPHFKRIRAEAMRRADYLCQRCKKARATQVHHLRYPPWGTFDVVENLQPVCYDCHCIIHNKEK